MNILNFLIILIFKNFFKTMFGTTLFLPHEIMKSGIFTIFRVSSL